MKGYSAGWEEGYEIKEKGQENYSMCVCERERNASGVCATFMW